MKREYGRIYIKELTESSLSSREYPNDLDKREAEKLITRLKQLAKDYILANDCYVELVDYQDGTGFGFYIINKKSMGLIKVYYEIHYQKEDISELDFKQGFEDILSDFFEIENPAGLLNKVPDEEETEDFFRMTIEGKLS